MGRECTLSMHRSLTEVRDIKLAMETQWGVGRYRQTLLHHNVVLKDHLKFDEAGIEPGDTLTLVARIAAGPLGKARSAGLSTKDDEDDKD